jgi:hypothetical protein
MVVVLDQGSFSPAAYALSGTPTILLLPFTFSTFAQPYVITCRAEYTVSAFAFREDGKSGKKLSGIDGLRAVMFDTSKAGFD